MPKKRPGECLGFLAHFSGPHAAEIAEDVWKLIHDRMPETLRADLVWLAAKPDPADLPEVEP